MGHRGQPQPESNLGQWLWEKWRAGSCWKHGRERCLWEGPPWRLEWGLPERLTCPCLLLLITDPTHHRMVGLT